MTKLVIVINGVGGVGKDKLIERISEEFDIINYSTAQSAKEMARLIGWNAYDRSAKARTLLHNLKMAIQEYNGYATEELHDTTRYFEKSNVAEILFVHIREVAEIKAYREWVKKETSLPCFTLMVERDGYNVSWGNCADDNVWRYAYDCVITLHGLEDDSPQQLIERIRNWQAYEELTRTQGGG